MRSATVVVAAFCWAVFGLLIGCLAHFDGRCVMSTFSDTAHNPALVDQILRVVVAVMGFLLAALFAALFISWSVHIDAIVPSTMRLVADFSLIIVGAVLAEVATPSREADTSWNLTSFTVATATLAPLALYTVEVLGNNPNELKLNVLIAILQPEHPWTGNDQAIYRWIVSLDVFFCLIVATAAAYTQRHISSYASHKASLAKYALSYVVLFLSIFVFCTYILLTYPWTNVEAAAPLEQADPTSLVKRFIILIGVLSILATLVVCKVHGFSGVLRPYLGGQKDRSKSLGSVLKASVLAIVYLLVIILPAAILFDEFAANESLKKAAIVVVGDSLSSLKTWLPEEFANKVVDLYQSS